MKKNQVIFGLLIFAVLLAGAFFAYNALVDTQEIPRPPLEAEDAEDREPAPDFAVEDAYGNEVRLSDFFGTPIVLNFWTTWCPSCVREIPYFEELDPAGEFQVLKVNLTDGQRETRSSVEEFLAARGSALPVYFDKAGEASRAYNVRTIPVTFFIDAAGQIATTHQGAMNTQTLQDGLGKILR